MTKKKNEPKVIKFIIGQEYRTRGGWKVICIWTRGQEPDSGGWFIHKPDTKDETTPIFHDEMGKAEEVFSVHPLPSFGKHPADIIGVWNDDEVNAAEDVGDL